jgi:diguanylate cyclase (GGDEF)-like protein
LRWELLFGVGATLNAAVVGAFVAMLASGPSHSAQLLAVGFGLVFAFAFVALNIAMPYVASIQALFALVPLVVVFASRGRIDYSVIAVLCLCILTVVISTVRCASDFLVDAVHGRIAAERIAQTDGLTGVMNRPAVLDEMRRRIAGHPDRPFAAAFVDLDHFKGVNDAFGHHVGDEVLREVAARLRTILRAYDIPARFGGDEFVVVVDSVTLDEAALVAARISEFVGRPFAFGGRAVPLGASVGVAHYPTHAGDVEELLRFADVALYKAKALGRGRSVCFDSGMRDEAEEAALFHEEIVAAADARKFFPAFEPVVDLDSGNVVGYEAIPRWLHPRHGLVGPEAFVDGAEKSRRLVDVNEHILFAACQQAAGWTVPASVAVNVSPSQLRDPVRLLASVCRAIVESGLEPARLEIEIPENAAVESIGNVRTVVYGLVELGVKIVLDDFGAGHSSFQCVRSVPFDKVKFQIGTLEVLDDVERAAAVARAFCGMAAELGASTVAVGVGTPVQLALAKSVGASHAQGGHVGVASSVPAPGAFLAA